MIRQDSESRDVAAGRSVQRHVLTTDLDGGQLALTVHDVTGSQPGPTVALVATVHGNEWFYVEVVRRVLDSLDPATVRGRVLAIPVANPAAFGQLSRTTPDASDTSDLNRAFPGRYTSITDQLAAAIEKHVLQHSNFLIQYDCGPWGWAIGEIMYGTDYPDAAVTEQSRAMALAYGYPLVRSALLVSEHPGPRSLAGYAATKYRIPSILAEIGGSGFGEDDEERRIALNVSGTRGVLYHVGLLDEPLPHAKPPRVCSRRVRVKPSVGGMLEPLKRGNELGAEIAKGELLANVRDPFNFELLEELRSPTDGWLFYVARPQPVRPGDFSMGVMTRDSAEPVVFD